MLASLIDLEHAIEYEKFLLHLFSLRNLILCSTHGPLCFCFVQVSRLLSLFQDTGAPSQPPRHPVDFRSAHQSARPPTLTDPPYIPSAAPPPLLNNQFYSAPPNDSYSFAAAPSPPQPRDQYYAASTGYPAAPPPPPLSNDQYYAAHPYYPAQLLASQPNYQHYPAPPN